MPGEQEEQEEQEEKQFDPSYDLSAVAAGKKGAVSASLLASFVGQNSYGK